MSNLLPIRTPNPLDDTAPRFSPHGPRGFTTGRNHDPETARVARAHAQEAAHAFHVGAVRPPLGEHLGEPRDGRAAAQDAGATPPRAPIARRPPDGEEERGGLGEVDVVATG